MAMYLSQITNEDFKIALTEIDNIKTLIMLRACIDEKISQLKIEKQDFSQNIYSVFIEPKHNESNVYDGFDFPRR